MRALIALSLTLSTPAWSTPPAVGTPPTNRPAGVQVRRSTDRLLLTDVRGHVLYVLNMRLAMARTGQSNKFCVGPCAVDWIPLAPTATDKAVGDWTIAAGAEGRQWAYKNALVFEFRADRGAGDLRGDGYKDIFKAATYVPPPPKILAPPSVQPTYFGNRFILTDQDKHPLVTGAATERCKAVCRHDPLMAGMAARPIGDWTVLVGGDHPQWAYRGRPVFVARMLDGNVAPPSAIVVPAAF